MKEDKLLPFKMDLTDALSIWRAETFWLKEPETVKWLEYFSSQKSLNCKTFYDVGANVGIYTLYWLTLNIESNSISIEPFNENLNLLIRNIKMNNFTHRVKVVNQPLASRVELGFYNVSDNRPGGSSFKFDLFNNPDLIDSKQTESLTIDSLFSTKLGPSILKIDVDGTDFEILQGARLSLKSNEIISVLIESSEEKQKEIENYLKKFDYVADPKFNEMVNHSDERRKINGNHERNRVYTKSYLIN